MSKKHKTGRLFCAFAAVKKDVRFLLRTKKGRFFILPEREKEPSLFNFKTDRKIIPM